VATSCVIEIDPEPVEIKDSDDEVEIQSDPSGNASSSGPPESKHMEHIQAAKNLESCSPIPVEESEESSSCTASSNDGESDSERAPSMVVKHGLDDAQAVVARILEERRHGNLDSTGFQSVALDNTMGYLRDRVALHAAREELTVIAEDKKRDHILRSRIRDMVGLLNLFLDEDLRYTWRKASLVIAKSHSHNVARARLMRHWVLHFLQTDELPHPKYSWTRSTILQDEDISQEIQAELGEKMKQGSIKATDLADVVASPRIQEKLKHAGINRPFISERTADRWLATLGWRYGKLKNGMYIDGHEREDIVQYRTAFVQRFKQYERRFHLWDDTGKELPPPRGFPVPEAAGRFRLILVTHDESTFFQNDQRNVGWDCEGSNKTPRPKGDGQSLMVSDFLTVDWGRLCDDDRCALHFVLRVPLYRADLILSFLQ
jgi:hypothetical protein